VDITEELPTVLSFCSGAGGIERGLELAGFKHRVIAFSEIEAYAIANLANKMEAGKLLPAPIWSNLKTLPVQPFRDKVDLITGGYPCQPFSAAGQRKGTDDPRHLWPYIRGHIESIRPVRCFFENVEGHISLGLREVIADLESLGYTATWGIFSAREVGAPHQRKRVYILANSERDPIREQSGGRGWENGQSSSFSGLDGKAQSLADSISARGEIGLPEQERPDEKGNTRKSADGDSESPGGKREVYWPPEPRVGRVVDGCPDRVDRIRLLGNAVVPQTAAKAWLTLNGRLAQ
jgi:DNA (cytosine-5)-methyltransferase 1